MPEQLVNSLKSEVGGQNSSQTNILDGHLLDLFGKACSNYKFGSVKNHPGDILNK